MRWLAVVVLVAACAAPGSGETPPPGAVVIVAQNSAFTTQHVTAPANVELTLWFQNLDHELHNVHISDANGGHGFHGTSITGPDAITEQVEALPAGTYPFICDIHPTMTGELVVQ